MDEEDGEFLLMKNYATLKTHLKIDCSQFLGNILKMLYEDINTLKESETFKILDDKSRQEIVQKRNFVFSIPALCEVLLKTNFDIEGGKETWHADVNRLREIWNNHIDKNKKISSDLFQKIHTDLQNIGNRMAERFQESGSAYVKSIRQLQQDGKWTIIYKRMDFFFKRQHTSEISKNQTLYIYD